LGVGLDELMGTGEPRKQAKKGRSKSGITFVYFDINGCLVRFFHRAFTRISQETGVSADVIETAFWHNHRRACRGEVIMAAFNLAFAKTIGVERIGWAAYYLDAIDPVEAMREMVRWADRHYRIGLLTNIMPGLVRLMLDRGLLPDVGYDVIVDSSEVRVIK